MNRRINVHQNIYEARIRFPWHPLLPISDSARAEASKAPFVANMSQNVTFIVYDFFLQMHSEFPSQKLLLY